MKELSFDSGLVTYSLNNRCEVTFNPTDSNFVQRLYSAFEELDKRPVRRDECVRHCQRPAGLVQPDAGRYGRGGQHLCPRAKGHKPPHCQIHGQISKVPKEING